MARRGLGKGLDALIPGGFESEIEKNGHQTIPIAQINPNPSQPRSPIKDDQLKELADSIREHGILQPLILTHNLDESGYTLIAGERRLRAARIAGLESVPAIVREANDRERLELALIENLQREDLSPVEAAVAYQKLHDEFNLSQEEIAERVGKNRVTVANTLRLLKLSDKILTAIGENKITEGHGRALLGLSNKKAQEAAYQTILKNGLNVRQTEELVRKLSGNISEKTTKTNPTPKSPEVKSMESRLRDTFGTKVTINHGKKGGTIVIHYYSDEELNNLLDQFTP